MDGVYSQLNDQVRNNTENEYSKNKFCISEDYNGRLKESENEKKTFEEEFTV